MKLRVFIGAVIGALFLYLTLRQIDFTNTVTYMRGINPAWIALVLVVYSSAF